MAAAPSVALGPHRGLQSLAVQRSWTLRRYVTWWLLCSLLSVLDGQDARNYDRTPAISIGDSCGGNDASRVARPRMLRWNSGPVRPVRCIAPCERPRMQAWNGEAQRPSASPRLARHTKSAARPYTAAWQAGASTKNASRIWRWIAARAAERWALAWSQ